MAVVASAEAGLRATAKGATLIQLRAPESTASFIEREATRLVHESAIPVLISSRADIALATGAAGVNLPEQDIGVADARRLLGRRMVGRSVHSLDSALRAEREGADYVIFGPVWETPSHPRAVGQGVDALRRVAEGVDIPVLAIGGVTAERVEEVLTVCGGYASISMFR